jgi:hypothetical protein
MRVSSINAFSSHYIEHFSFGVFELGYELLGQLICLFNRLFEVSRYKHKKYDLRKEKHIFSEQPHSKNRAV